jgi:hypothetical protein
MGSFTFVGTIYNENKEALDKVAYEIVELNKVEESTKTN